jgi:hypothetical protein
MSVVTRFDTMRHLMLGVIMMLASAAGATHVVVSLWAPDLYRASSGLMIETRGCAVYALNEPALLQWDGHKGKLIFGGGAPCRVILVHGAP